MKLVMIIEDDIEIRNILEETLEFYSYETIAAANGREALEILKHSKNLPQLILLDLMMPIMNGWDFAKEIKNHKELTGIPILVVSAFVDKASSIECVGFIEKPIIMDKFLTRVESLFGKARQ